MNTYIKMLSGIYLERELKYDRKDFLVYLYSLYARDHPEALFDFGTEMF